MLPESIPDYLALVGDTADGFPGIPGWGAKSTASVLAHYGHLEEIPALAKDWVVDVRGSVKLATNLAAQREDADLFKVLATLRDDAEVGIVDDWEWIGPDAELRRLVQPPRRGRHRPSRRTSSPSRGDDPPMSPTEDAVLVDRSTDEVAVVTLNRPDRRNAMNYALLDGLYDRARPTCGPIPRAGSSC